MAIARKQQVAVWHMLTRGEADRHAEAENVAGSILALAYMMGVRRLPNGAGARQYVRDQLDKLELGQELTHFMWGKKHIKPPRSPDT